MLSFHAAMLAASQCRRNCSRHAAMLALQCAQGRQRDRIADYARDLPAAGFVSRRALSVGVGRIARLPKSKVAQQTYAYLSRNA